MPTVSTVAELQALAKDPRNKGKTFQVTKDVFDHFVAALKGQMKAMPEAEKPGLECLLGTPIADISAALTRDNACTKCGHKLSFSDHVASAILSGAHTAEQMRGILLGDKFWLTIDTDQLRLQRCPRCYQDFLAVHCCYTSSSYAYA